MKEYAFKANLSYPAMASVACLAAALYGCSSSMFTPSESSSKPISNPFNGYRQSNDTSQNMILRTKKGDRSVEIEIPAELEQLSDFVLPVSPAFKDGARAPASADAVEVDDTYKNRSPSYSDREITRNLSHGSTENDEKRQEIERSLNLTASDEDSTEKTSNASYLASTDHIKQLYKAARYEAALLETDEMIRVYQTDPKLYQMRGTLLDRLGRKELALKAWNQALRFDTGNISLKNFIDRKTARTPAGGP